MKIKINLNGRDREFEVSPNEYLLETLRNNHITSVKNGCNDSSCGVCTGLNGWETCFILFCFIAKSRWV